MSVLRFIPVSGLHGPGMHRYILDEAELGERVAMHLDTENNCGWSALDDVIFDRDSSEGRTQPHGTTATGNAPWLY